MSEKKYCDVALDLMLLAQDGLNREGSKAFLQEHLEGCPRCREIYEALKRQPQSLQAEENPSQRDQALAKGMKKVGRRMRLWTRIAAVCLVVVLVMLGIAGVQSWRWNRVEPLPLELYDVGIASYEAILHLDAAFRATNIQSVSMTTVPEDENGLMANGDPVIVTYQVNYFPLRAEQEKMISPQSRFDALDYHSMCIVDGQVYMVAKSEIVKENGRDVVLMTPGCPVSEIRVSDGKETRTMYTKGDEVSAKQKFDTSKEPTFRMAE